MSEPNQPDKPFAAAPVRSEMFASKPPEDGGMPVMAWGVAGLVVLVLFGAVLFATRSKKAAPSNTVQPLAAYASSLPLTQLAMSESTSLSGGKSTFIDGHIKNTGSQTITGITVQVLFRNDENMPPQLETLPLALIRTREPYIDTQPVGAAPLKPGDEQDFRLIFEVIPPNWNTQMPEVHVIEVASR
ncbi:DUF2393 family protein [Granulicella sp. L60]|uniref:DUF2393 family protein n=1 Tax=Granulicella sp. L60 TaxID=1641866 RepID=UPI00131D8BF9|nr:DUF2393 family protein [Granulicella sp. L60]